MVITANNIELTIDECGGTALSLKLGGVERLFAPVPLFCARLRDKEGKCTYIDALSAGSVSVLDDGIVYSVFDKHLPQLTVKLIIEGKESVSWRIEVTSVPREYALEWVEIPKVCLPRLVDNDPRGGKIVFPYDEGIMLTDETLLPRYEPEFPSSGAYFTFPNKVCSQFMAYLFDDMGLYIGAHDTKRGLKGVDFYKCKGGVSLQMRLYSGCDFGEDFLPSFPVVWSACQSNWKSPAAIYRSWFEKNLPVGVIPLSERKSLPQWYSEAPLVVTYPVRGAHDMDKMEPNPLFPYTNALPLLNEIKDATGCRIMALLMHWEGTAPWAPPYVWPPFGGVELFNEFRDRLHETGDLLGVYCSGFGYTLRSTLIDSYNCEEKIKAEGVLEGVCHSPENKPELGITCTPYQRYGYDICPASKKGREILEYAYAPLFDSGVDYTQILDQNHGGGQYLCYAREHNHPAMPGEWMTLSMQELLGEWNDRARGMLFGCESAAAEPFIGNLLMSDNRFELNYPYGHVIPLYSFIYHEYVRNFMGNQCGCPFDPKCDTLRYRLAYSFSIGDIMTLIANPKGGLMSHWGTPDLESAPNMELALKLIGNLKKFYDKIGKKYLYGGKMSQKSDIECESITVPLLRGRKEAILPRLLSSAWETENAQTAYIVVNPENEEVSFTLEGKQYSAPALDATLIII